MVEQVAGVPQERRIQTPIPGPRSAELWARRENAVPAAVSTTLPVFVDHAGGAVLVDVDGNSLIDFGSGIAVTNVGHAAPRVVEAVQEQVARFTHTCFMVTPYQGYVEVCEALNELVPGRPGVAKRSFLVNSGAEAVENAVKVARAATGREAVIVFDHAFHGRTLLTMTLTAKAAPYKRGFGPFAPEVYRVPMAYPFRWPGGPDRCAEEALGFLREAVDKQIGRDAVAAVLIEPIQGEGGFIVPPPGFLPALADFCAEAGIVLIADEIQTGFGRTGDLFACEHEGVAPDLVATAKGLAGGLPLAGVTGRADLLDSVHVGGLGGTFGGNPVSCAAALAAIETVVREDLAGRARHIETVMRPRLEEIARRHPQVGEVRGRGAMLAMEIVAAPGDRAPNPQTTSAVARACHAEGLVVLTAGTYGNVLRFLPPLAINDELLDEGLTILEKAFATVG